MIQWVYGNPSVQFPSYRNTHSITIPNTYSISIPNANTYSIIISKYIHEGAGCCLDSKLLLERNSDTKQDILHVK